MHAGPLRLLRVLFATAVFSLVGTTGTNGHGNDDAVDSLSHVLATSERQLAHGRRLSTACAARGRALTGCPLAPESTAGPFATTAGLVRQNITEGLPGVPFVLDVELVNSHNCEPVVEGVAVEIWHCNALGEYSAFVMSGGTPVPSDTTFLRGVQFTNASGVARFISVFPGWCVHACVRAHSGAAGNAIRCFFCSCCRCSCSR